MCLPQVFTHACDIWEKQRSPVSLGDWWALQPFSTLLQVSLGLLLLFFVRCPPFERLWLRIAFLLLKHTGQHSAPCLSNYRAAISIICSSTRGGGWGSGEEGRRGSSAVYWRPSEKANSLGKLHWQWSTALFSRICFIQIASLGTYQS